MAAAYKTAWKQEHPDADDDFVGFRAEIDPETGEMRMFQQELEEVEAEDGESLVMKVLSEEEVAVTDDFTGRIGAQTAKQVIFQKLRDAEREMTYEEFAGREGDVVTGIVQQSERRYTLLDLGKVEALLPQAEQVPVRAVPQRRAPEGLHHRGPPWREGPADRREPHPPGAAQEAVRDGGARDRGRRGRDPRRRARARPPVEDRGVVERARGRSGRARASGPKGSRVRNVVTELRGEKIDVVPWSDDPERARRERAAAGEGRRGDRRPRHPDRAGDRPGLPAVARDREGRAERPARRAAHRLADRHQVGDAGAPPSRRRPRGR